MPNSILLIGGAGAIVAFVFFRKPDAKQLTLISLFNRKENLTPIGDKLFSVFGVISAIGIIIQLTTWAFGGSINNAENLYHDLKRANPISKGITEEYLGGKVLQHCSLGKDHNLIFGWVKYRRMISMGGMTSGPTDSTLYVLSDRFNEAPMNVLFRGQNYAQDLIDYAAVRGCTLTLD